MPTAEQRFVSFPNKYGPYDDIRYIIVPNTYARISTIKTITSLPESCFEDKEDIMMQKNVLISKILVLEEIRKDW